MTRLRDKRTFRLDPGLARKLDERARARGVTRTEIVEAALASLLSPDHEEQLEAAFARRLDRLTRRMEQLSWQLDLSNEALALFVRSWLVNNPPIPDDALRAARASASGRWEAFVASLARRMEGGSRLADEIALPDQPVA